VGTPREIAFQIADAGVHLSFEVKVFILRSSKQINSSPNVVDVVRQVSIPAINGQKFFGCSLR
jgi:hypothetical protein